jgi:HSP20 family protein
MAFWNRELLPSFPSTPRWAERALSPLSEMEEMIDRLRRDFYAPDVFREVEGFSPRIEVKETDKKILISAEIPGMKEKEINVSLRENNLMIEGEKVKEKKKEEMGYYRSEFSYGHFYRTISLPAEVDQDKVEATYENGVLNISLNKLTEGKQTTKKIEIKH